MEEIRFYMKNIPPEVSEEDVQKHFQKLGDIYNITLKQNYGFFSFKSQPDQIPKIVAKYSNKRWNSYLITLEKSEKESFMERLARERQTNNEVADIKEPPLINRETCKIKKKRTEAFSVDDENQEKVKAGVPMFPGTKPTGSAVSHLDLSANGARDVMSSFSKFDPMWADKEKTNISNHDVSQYLQSTEKTREHIKTKERGFPLTKAEKKIRDDERRRQSLANKAKEKLKQQNFIQSALSNSNTVKPKKVIFDSDDEEPGAKINLFDESQGENESFILPFKEHFEGESGRELLHLQSQFNNDERFKLDERFLDDEGNEVKKNRKETKLEMVRYDPTKSTSDSSDPKTTKVRNDITTMPAPVVSKEKFYEISDAMKTSLQQHGSGFSLLETYGKKQVEVKPQESSVREDHERVQTFLKRNPMLMDSSDEDAETEFAPKIWAPTINIPFGARENFFFSENDPLITEAFEFMNKKNSEESVKAYENYFETRNMLRRIFKGQILKSSKKTDMFKKKVGGMKKKTGNFNIKHQKSPKGKR